MCILIVKFYLTSYNLLEMFFLTVLVLNLIITSSASDCIDDKTIDCERLNALFGICKETQKAKEVCPEFCGLCHLVDVDGGWGSWSEWTHCSVTCEQGIIERQRSCSNPMPANDGLNCTGDFYESKECFTAAPCPVNGNWSEWSEWNNCSTSCEVGIQSRTRTCTNPKPDILGDYCSGPNFDVKLCDKGPCSDGGWSSWSSWTPCNTKNGYGIKTQSRTCTNPTPSPRGTYCVGDSMRVDICYDFTAVCSTCADCSEIKTRYPIAPDGIYNVTLWKTKGQIQVYCDMTTSGGGWTVFQYRYNGEVDFYRNFTEYVNGFGDLQTEFWLGLDFVEEMTSKYKSQLRVDLTSANGTTAFEVLDEFSLGASPEYTLHVGTTSSSHNIGSSYRFGPYHNGMPFSTYDNDVDKKPGNCASTYHGAWWYKNCFYVNLNGKYVIPGATDAKGIHYYNFLVNSSLKGTRLSFRRSPT